jgi:hypothetical protein
VENAGISSSSNQTDNSFRVMSERSRLPWFNSSVRLTTEWDWQLRNTEVKSETKNRYAAEISAIMKVTPRLQLMASARQETESYSTDAKTNTGDVELTSRPSIERRSFRVDAQTRPTDGLSLGVGGMLASQNDSEISRMTMSLSGRLPKIDLPIRSYLIAEKKALPGLDDQTSLQVSLQTSHNFRRISVVLTYSLFREKLRTEKYTFSEFYVKISRAFEMF